MKIAEFSWEFLPDLTRLVNSHISSVPPGWLLSDAQVARILGNASAWSAHYPEDKRTFLSPIVCALDSGRLVAAAKWNWPNPEDPEWRWGEDYLHIGWPSEQRDVASLAWILAVPDSVDAAQLLLRFAIEQCEALGCHRATVSERFEFGVGWFGIPANWTHVIAALQRTDFAAKDRWVTMVGSTTPSQEIAVSSGEGVTFRWRVGESGLEWLLEACVAEAVIGECEAWGIPTHFEGCSGFERWITIEWIGVEEASHRRGVGCALLQEQMRFHHNRGVRELIAWTEPDNVPAVGLGESLGFRYGAECWTFSRRAP